MKRWLLATFPLLVSISTATRADEAAPSVDEIAQRLRDNADTGVLYDVERLGEKARPLVPLVANLLRAENWDRRVDAARTLGRLGDPSVASALVDAMRQDEDIELAGAAARSLGELRATAARPALDAIAASNWYPPMRSAAEEALRRIDGVETSATLHDDVVVIDRHYLGGGLVDIVSCTPAVDKAPEAPRGRRLEVDHDLTRLQSMA